MYLLLAVINNEHLLEDILTGWLDIGITGATVVESTDLLRLISDTIPIFAGFRSLTSGGPHNKTVFTAIESKEVLDEAVAFLETQCRETGRSHQGVYMVAPLLSFDHLGANPDTRTR
ncbi:MAG: hypothetical protein ACLFOY_00355 [Desulfatibacillaceae bacterium]